ncbi:glycogen debranching protein GlgX [Aphanothece sacrum]|uniref:Glycogen debranching enzyme n=1 Tax=Aphanothece sacrum FPU1 TaxID=1920663 RepID=A0A401ILU4_APHSA|nr:glycogen debranching protein GlgX [Aphanothece sacrum]GBF82215.1 glycogen debranching enzyme [Aphanothece sacrum FPU1]GBF87247.1 glycogen debranching enzyme GlgX [Aphanothece sacrum FPU3]
MLLKTLPGESHPLGATVEHNGVNFCLFSKHATAVELLLFDQPNAPQPIDTIPLDPQLNRTHYYWHIFIPELQAGQVYAYRVDGPYTPEKGHRFDKNKVLLDPYGKAIVGSSIYNRNAARQPGDNCAQALRNVVIDNSNYDWEGDRPLRLHYSESVIYEMHVGGFTRNPNSGLSPEKRGTFAGLIEKIPYLKNLGITAVELLPVHYFDPEDAMPGLTNYWGYSTINFFTPHRSYSSDKSVLGPINEFRDMVKALHKAGIEVILDVVFNHTAEGDERGATLCFRGIDNETYYILEPDLIHYKNYSGCGNTFRGNHPIVGRLILDCLRYWVTEMHVDGFRFDLASVLTRDAKGNPLENRQTHTPDILWSIESDPALAGTKLIAEAWDAAGLYDVGRFVELADWFAEWNGPFRDDVRRFIKGDAGMVPCLAARILGSPDIYHRIDTDVNRSINFITCHDGFSLNDLVSYNEKHNEANKENSRDGANDNYSWNCGIEGETDDPKIEALRLQQIKNFLTILFISQGTPMILMGDEVRHTRKGNNNVYCQDNELNWFDWEEVDRQFDLWCFVRRLIHFIQGLQLFRQEERLEVTYASLHHPYISWHGTELGKPDWSDYSRCLAFSLRHPDADEHLHVMLNSYWKPLEFELPVLGHGESWYRVIDTALPLSETFCELDAAYQVKTQIYEVQARSCVILMVQPI